MLFHCCVYIVLLLFFFTKGGMLHHALLWLLHHALLWLAPACLGGAEINVASILFRCTFVLPQQRTPEIRLNLYNLAKFVFEHCCDSQSSRILSSFAKIFHKSLFAIYDCTITQFPNTSSITHSCSPLSRTHFLT